MAQWLLQKIEINASVNQKRPLLFRLTLKSSGVEGRFEVSKQIFTGQQP